MKITEMIKKRKLGVLAWVFVLSGTVSSSAYAATTIDTDRKCSVFFKLDGNLESEFGELKDLEIPVRLYKTADVDPAGVYTALDGFEELGFDRIESTTTAAEWEKMAETASGIVKEIGAKPLAEVILTNGEGKAADLETGMYLVEADNAASSTSEYRFTPYLLSLPNHYLGTTGSDEWVYDVTAGLKPGKDPLLGSLIIDKTLTSYNSTLQGADFVFQVEGVLDNEVVYSNVVSLVFDGPGTKSIRITGLPAGTHVTVTEVYSGASYEITTSLEQTAVIIADGQEGSPVHVVFKNKYNGGLNGGSSVVNQFLNQDGVWEWQQQTDSTSDQK